MLPRHHRRSGFTMIEAVVAIVIVAMTVISSTAALAAHLRALATTNEAAVRDAIASAHLESLRVLPGSHLRSLPDSLVRGRALPPFHRFTWDAEVKAWKQTERVFALSVSVSGPNGKTTLSTLMYRDLGSVTP